MLPVERIRKMWQLTAIVLGGVLLFFWGAFVLTVVAWLKMLAHLLMGNFIRSALWLNLGIFLLFWWTDKPHDWDTMMPGIVFFTGLGALGTFARYHIKRKAMLAIPTMPTWTPPKPPA